MGVKGWREEGIGGEREEEGEKRVVEGGGRGKRGREGGEVREWVREGVEGGEIPRNQSSYSHLQEFSRILSTSAVKITNNVIYYY